MGQFGAILRSLRSRKGISLKRLAPDLGVTYGYLSKLENDESTPSPDLVQKVAAYFSYDTDHLMISAGRIPDDVLRILQENPEDAIGFLRERFGDGTR